MIKKAVFSTLIVMCFIGIGLLVYKNNAVRGDRSVSKPFFPKLITELGMLLKKESSGSATKVDAKPSVFEGQLEPITEKPTRLFTQALDGTSAVIDVTLIEVGVGPDGVLEAPTDFSVGGWYKKSSQVGAFGNIVIDGHYDDNFGRPAAFWNLKNIKVGDKVYLVDAYGRPFTYEVTEVFYVSWDDPDRLRIFQEDKSKSTLTLITCGGVWLPGQATYNQRLVVKASRVVS